MDSAESENDQVIEEWWETYDAAVWETSSPTPDAKTAPIADIEDRPGKPENEASDDFETPAPLDLDPCWIDLKIIRQWLYTCDLDPAYGEKCIPKILEHDGLPLWLIDVVNEYIVPAGQRQCVALSYVWGQVTSSAATMDNIDSLRVHGALREDNIAIVVPRTVRHVMNLVELLGLNYLWVD